MQANSETESVFSSGLICISGKTVDLSLDFYTTLPGGLEDNEMIIR